MHLLVVVSLLPGTRFHPGASASRTFEAGKPPVGGWEDPAAADVPVDDGLADWVGLGDELGLADALGLPDGVGLGDELGLADALGLPDGVGLRDTLELTDALGAGEVVGAEVSGGVCGTVVVPTVTGTPWPSLTLREGKRLPAAPVPLSGLGGVLWRKGFSGF